MFYRTNPGQKFNFLPYKLPSLLRKLNLKKRKTREKPEKNQRK